MLESMPHVQVWLQGRYQNRTVVVEISVAFVMETMYFLDCNVIHHI
jgi:hypothetical protein